MTENIAWIDRAHDEGFASAHRILLRKNAPTGARYDRYRAEWIRRPAEFDCGKFPMNLDFEVNADCNLHCPMCYRQTGFRPRGELDIRAYEYVLAEASRYPDDWFAAKFNMRGESTLSPPLPNYVRLAKTYGCIDAILNTNGNFPSSMLPSLMEHLDVLAFSLDALTPETYKKIRVGGDYRLATGNVKKAIMLREEIGYKTRIRVSFVHQIINNDELEAFEAYWKNVGVDEVTVNLCFNPGMKNEREEYKSPYTIEQDPEFVCAQPWQRLMIQADGRAVPCCGDWETKMPLGDIADKSIYEMWHGQEMESLRAIQRNHQYLSLPLCATCGVSQNKIVRR